MDNKIVLLAIMVLMVCSTAIMYNSHQCSVVSDKYDTVLKHYTEVNETCKDVTRYDDRCVLYSEMYDKEMRRLSFDSNFNGLYTPNVDYYCVWVKERNVTEVQQTDYHEMCHSLVYNNWEHFCNISEEYRK